MLVWIFCKVSHLLPYTLTVHLSVMIMARYKRVSRNNLLWFQHCIFPCPTPSVPPSLLLLVARCEKGNRFTSATTYRKISQSLTSKQFLKMKNKSIPICAQTICLTTKTVLLWQNLALPILNHTQKCELKHE